MQVFVRQLDTDARVYVLSGYFCGYVIRLPMNALKQDTDTGYMHVYAVTRCWGAKTACAYQLEKDTWNVPVC